MTTLTVGRAATLASISLATITLALMLPSGAELAAASSGAGSPASAQAGSTPAPRIALVDTERIIASSKAGRAMRADLEQYGRQVEAELGTRQQVLKDLQARLAAAREAGNSEAIRQLEEAVQAKDTELRRQRDDAAREYKKRQDAALVTIEAQVMPAINTVAREGGYNLVFRKFESGLVYADDAMDITNVVVARMDATTP